MSFEITTAMVRQYNDNIVLLQQQKASRLRRAVREESVQGEYGFFDQIDATAAVKRTTRHGDTPLVSTPHVRRRVSMSPYDWADLIDIFDRAALITDPTSKYVVNAVAAMNRAIDDAIILAALATAYGGVDGSSSYTFDTSSYRIAHGSAGLSLAKLASAKEILDAAENDPDEERYFILNAKQLAVLLQVTEVKSADYNTVKALVQGQLDTFMGFKFIRTERLAVASSVRSCLAYSKNSILVGVGTDVITRVSERADKNYSTQVYCGMNIGATRMDEKGVVEVQAWEG
jgi:hypothetical protein